ncbi:MAG: glycosyltransferase family 4 protein [archaeon]|jgi:glycosyltransferase involved in cell wall biosynthesis
MKTILFWGAKEYPIGYKYSDNLAGGIETAFQRIIYSLKHKLKIKVITRKFKEQPNLEVQDNVGIIRVSTPSFFKGFFYNFNSFLYLLFRKRDYDTIVCSGIMSAFFAGALKLIKFNKFRLYCRWDTPAYISKTKLLYPLEKLTYSLFVDRFLLKAEFEAQRIKKLYSLKKLNYTVVGFGIDYKSPNSQKLNTIRKIAYIGRLDQIKNIFIMIDTFSKLNNNLELNIYGDGPLKNRMIAHIKKRNLKNVKYHGFVSDVKAKLQENDCLILLSKTEGLPNIILEAMILKKPIIMSDIGLFSKDIIYVVRLNDSKTMAKEIQQYLNNKQLQEKLVNNANNYCLKNFNFDKMLDNYENVLK